MHHSESSKRIEVLDHRNISLVLSQTCRKSRNVGITTSKCRGNCADNFTLIEDAFNAVKKLRQSIWIDPKTLNFNFTSHNDCGLDIRKSAFIKAIMSLANVTESGETVLTYFIEGVNVCKKIYMRATGLNRKLFNRGIAFVLCKEDDDRNQDVFNTLSEKTLFTHICGHVPFLRQTVIKSNVVQRSDNEHIVIVFLDLFFKENVNVDHAPEESEVRYVRDTWRGVYEDYLKHCSLIQTGTVEYGRFTSIR